MERLSGKTSLSEMMGEYPFLEEYLIALNPRFKVLRNKAMRMTIGRVATLARVAAVGGMELSELLEKLADRIAAQTGSRPLVDDTPPAAEIERIDELKEIIRELHRGTPVLELRERFGALLADVDPHEIAAMEERLMQEGMPVTEVQRLCDLHVEVFSESLEAHEELSPPPGHPIHTSMAENLIITSMANRFDAALKKLGQPPREERLDELRPELDALLDELDLLDNHYVRKENEFFPRLEKHGITGPTQVMWGVHDDIRRELKAVRHALEAGFAEPFLRQGTALVRMIVEMVFKENRILFPMCMQSFEEAEWTEVRRGEDEYGYAFAQPAAPWPNVPQPPPREVPATFRDGLIPLRTGQLTIDQLTQLLRHLPVEISFVDADGYVRFYSDQPHRLFPRMPGVIGRHVEKCHPPKSVEMVKAILAAFSAGERDQARFWIQMQGRFIVISYYAVRDDDGLYLGCLEVTQDATEVRNLQGERRLLEWE